MPKVAEATYDTCVRYKNHQLSVGPFDWSTMTLKSQMGTINLHSSVSFTIYIQKLILKTSKMVINIINSYILTNLIVKY